MKKYFSFLLTCLSTLAMAQSEMVQSPDGKLTLQFDLNAGQPTYSIDYDGQKVITQSPLGFVADFGDMTKNLKLTKTDRKEKQTTHYTLNRAKQSEVEKAYNQLTVTLANDKKQQYSIDFRIENNDVAFRYTIPNQPSKANGKKFSTRIMNEATAFTLPLQTRTFLTPQSDAMIGWKGTKPSYEEEYKFDEPMTTASQYGHGYTFPCLFRIPGDITPARGHGKGNKNQAASQQEDIWLLISETDVDSRYCGSRLSECNNGTYTIAFPMAKENNGNGTVEPAFSLPNSTPWRTLTIGRSLKPIVETTIPWDFVTPRYTTKHNYKFGKGTWSWIVWQDNSICWKDQVQYIALAKAMGYQYVLIDNWWDNNIGKEKMVELVKYAQSQGVDVFLWYSSSGWWNDIEQGPINIMDNPIRRKQYMTWMHEIGVKGIKVDFFGGDKQETMRLYEQILSDADDNGLMVIFHGCTIPRGWERMYPNYVGSEAVLASENIYFQQHFCDVEAQNTALHPFCRNTIGCMEFGGCFMNRHINRGNKGGNTRRTTDCHELATTVLFQNPIQNFALTPENLWGADGKQTADKQTDFNANGVPAPALCMDFLKQVPTTWDETRYIAGYPGKYCVLARRHGNTWYIAGNNATGKPLTLSLSLDMLQKGDALTLYTDHAKTKEPVMTSTKYNGKTLTVTMTDQGGFVIVK